MRTLLRVLLVEDNESDAALILRQLAKSSFEIDAKVVDSLQEIDKLLASHYWDVVFCDYQLPGFDAFAVLARIRAMDKDLPFLVISGTVGEYKAVELMRAGVHDYLMKDNLIRLLPALERELSEAQFRRNLRKAEQNLIAERERSELAIKATGAGVWDEDLLNNTMFSSALVRAMLGFEEKDYSSPLQEARDLFHPDDLRRMGEVLAGSETFGNDTPWEFEARVLTKDGAYEWFLVKGTTSFGPSGFPVRRSGTMISIEAKKTASDKISHLMDILETGNHMIATADMSGRMIYMNRAMQENLRLPPELEVTDISIADTHDPEMAEYILKNAIPKAVAEGTWTGKTIFRRFDGTHLDGWQSIIIHRNASTGEITHASTVIQDISDLTKSELTVRKLNQSLSEFQKAIYTSACVIKTSAKGIITFVNANYIRVSGFSERELLGRPWDEIMKVNSTFQKSAHNLLEATQIGETWMGESSGMAKNGDPFWLDCFVTPIKGEGGVIKEFLNVATDVTQRKNAENDQRKNALLLEQATNLAEIGHWSITMPSGEAIFSKKMLKLFGLSDDTEKQDYELFKRFIHPDDWAFVRSKLEECIHTLEPFEIEHRIIQQGGEVRWLRKVVEGILLDGQIVLNAVAQDITARISYRLELERQVKEQTQDLRLALDKEKEVVQMKNKFVSMASHEFRTPLATILVVSEFIKKYRDRLSPVQFDEKLNTLEKQVNHMAHLLDDVLLIGKSEADKIQVKYEQIDIIAFINQVAKEVSDNSKSHQVIIKNHCSVTKMDGDIKLLRNIVINLLTNAIKFSPREEIVWLNLKNEAQTLVIEVKDKGIGIEKSELVKVFSSFQRGSNVGAIAGTGLGLSIVQRAVDMMKGSVDVESELGEGTVFTVRLPMQDK